MEIKERIIKMLENIDNSKLLKMIYGFVRAAYNENGGAV